MSDKKTDWRQAFDLRHPMLKPLWVRILLVIVCICWAVVELLIGTRVWAAIVAAAGAYMAYSFFLSPDRDYYNRSDDPPADD